MRVTHWTLFNASGLANVAHDLAMAETSLGIESVLCDTMDRATWPKGMGADVHVAHSHIPDELAFDKKTRIVAVQHGSPEHAFELSVQKGLTGGYGAGDSWAIGAYLVRRADVVVTFWERQAAIWETVTGTPVKCIPLGIPTTFWRRQAALPPLAGAPSVMTAENHVNAKWPLDMFFMWPHIVKQFPAARLHALNIPLDQMKWWGKLGSQTGTDYTAYVVSTRLDASSLRNFLSAASFYYGPVRYGDFNRISLEAAACGCKVISYEGNEYAHYWVREGDQRRQRQDLLAILAGEIPPRNAPAVPDISETAKAMQAIYRSLL